MKKKVRHLFVFLAVVAVAWIGWRYAFQQTKDRENLPALEALEEDDPKGLVGYRRAQLISAWGTPDDTIGVGEDVWKREGKAEYLLVSYSANGEVERAEFVTPS